MTQSKADSSRGGALQFRFPTSLFTTFYTKYYNHFVKATKGQMWNVHKSISSTKTKGRHSKRLTFHSSVCSEGYFLKYLALVKQTECHEEMKMCAYSLSDINKQTKNIHPKTKPHMEEWSLTSQDSTYSTCIKAGPGQRQSLRFLDWRWTSLDYGNRGGLRNALKHRVQLW